MDNDTDAGVAANGSLLERMLAEYRRRLAAGGPGALSPHEREIQIQLVKRRDAVSAGTYTAAHADADARALLAGKSPPFVLDDHAEHMRIDAANRRADRKLAELVLLHPGKVQPVDDEARRLTEEVRRDWITQAERVNVEKDSEAVRCGTGPSLRQRPRERRRGASRRQARSPTSLSEPSDPPDGERLFLTEQAALAAIVGDVERLVLQLGGTAR